jgi:hypothetical protein
MIQTVNNLKVEVGGKTMGGKFSELGIYLN